MLIYDYDRIPREAWGDTDDEILDDGETEDLWSYRDNIDPERPFIHPKSDELWPTHSPGEITPDE